MNDTSFSRLSSSRWAIMSGSAVMAIVRAENQPDDDDEDDERDNH